MITSTANKQVKELLQLSKKAKARKENGVFVAEGLRMVSETPAELIEKVYVSESFLLQGERKLPSAPTEVLSDHVFTAVSDTSTPQGVLAVVKMPHYEEKDLFQKANGLFLVLETIQDPGNLGTMFRTAEGAGVSAIVLNGSCADLFQPKVVRSTMGSIYRVPFLVTEDLPLTVSKMKANGIHCYAAHLKGKVDYTGGQYEKASAFFIGNEGNGLSEELAAQADTLIRIPMGGKLESLNAAMAAGILMYEAARQRKWADA